MHLSMKLSDMFDQTPHHTLAKIMAKLVSMKNDLKARPSAQRSKSQEKAKDLGKITNSKIT